MLLLFACAAPVEDSAAPAFSPTEDAPWEKPAADAAYDVPTFEGIVAAALVDGVPHFSLLARAVTDIFDAGNAICPGPGFASYSIAIFDPAGCRTEEGYWYEGAGAFTMGLVDEDDDGRAETFEGEIKMDMSAADPAGHDLEVGGDSTLVATLGEAGPTAIAGTLAGTYRWSADETWLGRGVSMLLEYDVTYAEGGGVITLDGGFTVDDEPSVGFDELVVGGACGTQPTGAVLVRDGEGYWYRLDFDETTCDGCGTLSFDLGTELGRACVDLAEPTAFMAGSVLAWTTERLAMPGGELP